MKTISISNARKNIKNLVDQARETGEVFAIGRRNYLEAMLLRFPSEYNSKLSDVTNINAYSTSFDFLKNEPDLYSLGDIKKEYD